ncbi:unnamed protein product, partial [Mesorhabditis spiculigera]
MSSQMRWVAGLLALVLACSASTILLLRAVLMLGPQLLLNKDRSSPEIPTLNEQSFLDFPLKGAFRYNHESLEQALALTFGADREICSQINASRNPLTSHQNYLSLTKSNLVDSVHRKCFCHKLSFLLQVYGGQAVVEVIANSTPIQEKSSASAHNIVKRAVGDDPKEKDPFTLLRQQYNVSVAVSSDYAAIFAIFAGENLGSSSLSSYLYIAVGIWNMDPGRDSIIYRMTTTRMKKD